MKVKLSRWFKPASRKVTLTGQDIINLRQNIDHLQLIIHDEIEEDIKTLRDDVNDALSAAAKAIYQLEELEIRITTAEAHIALLED